MSLRSVLAPSLAGLALALVPVPAPPPAAADEAPGGGPVATPAGSATLHGRLGLSLIEAIEMALQNNLNVAVERYSPFIAYEDSRISWGAYDPEWFSEFGYSSEKTPNANVLVGTTISANRSTDGFGGIRGQIPFLNSQYNVQLNGGRTATNATIQVLSPELRSSVSASLTQPLLRDLIWNESWTRLKTTRVLYASSLQEFRRQVMDTVQGVEDAYWTLVAADEEARVARKSLETAQALLDQTQTQYDVGVVSRVEVTEAEAGVAQREFTLIVAENAYRNAQDVLIDAVLGPGLRAESTLEIEPSDRPEDYIPYDIDRDVAVQTAFEHRPELRLAEREIERQEVDLKFRRNQRLPRLDAVLSYGQNGLAGDQNPDFDPCRFITDDPATLIDERAACEASPPSTPSTDFGDSFDDYFKEDTGETFSARALFSIPIGNVAARHRATQGELELRRAVTSRRRIEQQIILEVRAAVRNLESAQEGIEAAERARVAAEEQLRSERIRLEYGESTPFDVLQREEDFVQAESGKIEALRVYRTSATGLDRAQGTILRSHNIAIDEVRALR